MSEEAPSAGEVPTPRTNTEATRIFNCRKSDKIKFGQMADFARQLERETIELGKRVERAEDALLKERAYRDSELDKAHQQIADLRQQLATEQAKRRELEEEEDARIASDPAEVLLRDSQQRELNWIQQLDAAHQRNRELVEAIEKQENEWKKELVRARLCNAGPLEIENIESRIAECALSRALTSPAVSPWQDIATAPKTPLSRILGYGWNGVEVIYWNGDHWLGQNYQKVAVTHWQPLLIPPSPDSGKDQQ